MNRKNEKLSPPSLAQHFDAPDDYVGHFGWLCGYSADADFLNDAAERFTRLTSAQRQRQGRIALAVLLDPGNPPISAIDAPSVAHLPIKDFAKKPFRLLHAKVALLGFKHKEDSSQWHLRLIVSTGNWTRQTLEKSLDLAWRVDISSEALITPDDDIRLMCADIKAVNNLMQWLATLFDTRLLSAAMNDGFSETKNAKTQFDDWMQICTQKATGQTRFFDNRNKSLLAQLPAKIKAGGNETTRNCLAMGSGFYESVADQSKTAAVPGMIIAVLRKANLLTEKKKTNEKGPIGIHLYVEPGACQAIATSVSALKKQGMIIRPTGQPSDVFGNSNHRKPHAKFLFSAKYQINSTLCNSAWVYLGSGNLTNPGFALPMSSSAGNLEAGVVFEPEGLVWNNGKNVDKLKVVTNLLPVQWERAIDSSGSQLSQGPGMEPRDVIYVAPPVAWLGWHKADGVSELRTTESELPDFQVVDSTGNACERSETGFLWREPQPRLVTVRWLIEEITREAVIPVIDQYGRIAATELSQIGVDEAWWQLADFPLPADDDGDDPDDGNNEINSNDAKEATTKKSSEPLGYPIRQMMELIESIAAKQTEINEMDWVLWCNRLEQTLCQARESTAVTAFLALGLNPLSPLWHTMFRPSFAETTESDAGRLYESTLVRIEKSWVVDQLTAIGGTQ